LERSQKLPLKYLGLLWLLTLRNTFQIYVYKLEVPPFIPNAVSESGDDRKIMIISTVGQFDSTTVQSPEYTYTVVKISFIVVFRAIYVYVSKTMASVVLRGTREFRGK
jgi:hypothetical protein